MWNQFYDPLIVSNVVDVSLSGGSLGYWIACNNVKRYCTVPYCEYGSYYGKVKKQTAHPWWCTNESKHYINPTHAQSWQTPTPIAQEVQVHIVEVLYPNTGLFDPKSNLAGPGWYCYATSLIGLLYIWVFVTQQYTFIPSCYRTLSMLFLARSRRLFCVIAQLNCTIFPKQCHI